MRLQLLDGRRVCPASADLIGIFFCFIGQTSVPRNILIWMAAPFVFCTATTAMGERDLSESIKFSSCPDGTSLSFRLRDFGAGGSRCRWKEAAVPQNEEPIQQIQVVGKLELQILALDTRAEG